MYRLGQLDEAQRFRIGTALLAVGAVLMAVGVILVHYAQFPQTQLVDGREVPVVVDYFNWIPRGWLPKAVGYLIAFAASQALLAGAAILWVLNQKMTWARAAFAAFLAWIEFVLIFGIVPSEWLNLSQTDLDWSYQREAFEIPSWLLLGNEVTVSLGAIKDAISGTYNLVALFGAAVFAYKLQDISKQPARPAAAEPPKSPYGRPLVRGEG
ncbi:MAG: hypothetical protein KatS3mg011_0446 [Acidimicrobiia bacterium]|jgi:hypothetical protein|nr:MAG: hypothetical protein KatS3mg011_0446 [Acidimicrobiia bacterium]